MYSANAEDGAPVAVKVLAEERSSRDKRARFKNEIAFLERNRHQNIVTVVDYGLLQLQGKVVPFYVMPRFTGSLRDLLRRGLQPTEALRLFIQLLDGIEAAHLQDVIHRDLKPENVLYRGDPPTLAIADFGIARFNEDFLATMVATAPAQRMANFQYAAPEQRMQGAIVTTAADMYALGLILNELFTGVVPHGTEYRLIGSVSSDHSYLDQIVALLLRQNPAERLSSVAQLKSRLQQYHAEAIALQRLSAVTSEVVATTTIDEPLAINPPKLVAADWNARKLTLTLDRPVNPPWVDALYNMGNFSSIMGHGPETFRFDGTTAWATVDEHAVQNVIDHFKAWLPIATKVLRHRLEQAAAREEGQRRERLKQLREAEEQRLRVLRNLRI